MLITVPDVLNAKELAAINTDLAAAKWLDGRSTAGRQSAEVKVNKQLARDDAVVRKWSPLIGAALGRSPRFLKAALPLHTLPPIFSRYDGGEHYGAHVDNAVRSAGGLQVRTDLAVTLFLADPDSYDGGALLVETRFGRQAVKLPAGGLVLYPASSLHQVEPVTRGSRLAAVFWVQSLIRDNASREMLFDLDDVMQSLGTEVGLNDPRILTLSATYQNLLRLWVEN